VFKISVETLFRQTCCLLAPCKNFRKWTKFALQHNDHGLAHRVFTGYLFDLF